MSIEQQAVENIKTVETALRHASSLPYNNASNIYAAAGIETPKSIGGSCLFKLAELRDSLHGSISNVEYITAKDGDIIHYAMLADMGETYYFDPFLWQGELMPISGSTKPQVETLLGGWIIRREPNEEGSFLKISFMDIHDPEKPTVLKTHRFTDQMSFLPNASTLPIKPDLPSFMIQIPSSDGVHFYKVWYSKKGKKLDDIWVTNTLTGERKKVPVTGTNSELRPGVIKDVESLIGMSQADLCRFFAKAHDLEITLSELRSRHEDAPHDRDD